MGFAGTQLIMWTCHGGLNQQFKFGRGIFETGMLINRNSGKCVDVYDGSKNNAAAIIQWDCHGGSNQQWRLTRDI